jgi:5-methylcytosine-specific restriction endonuclease McrA
VSQSTVSALAIRSRLKPKTKFEVLQRDGFCCVYCGRKAPDVQLHVDHVVPVSGGGSNDLKNLVAACAECNVGKGKRTA